MSDNDLWFIHFNDANSRPTYFDMHSVREARELSKGSSVRVGILDHLFGNRKHPNLYTQAVDFAANSPSLEEDEGHGYWMACVLKEIAPECQIVALNVANRDPTRFAEAIVRALQWASENGIDILTCSHGKYVYDANREAVDAAVTDAITHGIVTVFLHYDHPVNLLPDGVFPWNGRQYERQPDINVWHYDYNTLLLDQYRRFLALTEVPKSGDDIPYFSMSSTAAVGGGFVALMKSLAPGRTPAEYKQVLIETSYKREYNGIGSFEHGIAPRVVNIERALTQLQPSKNDRNHADDSIERRK